MNRNLPPWAYLLAVWVFWFIASAVVCAGMLIIGAIGLGSAG